MDHLLVIELPHVDIGTDFRKQTGQVLLDERRVHHRYVVALQLQKIRLELAGVDPLLAAEPREQNLKREERNTPVAPVEGLPRRTDFVHDSVNGQLAESVGFHSSFSCAHKSPAYRGLTGPTFHLGAHLHHVTSRCHEPSESGNRSIGLDTE